MKSQFFFICIALVASLGQFSSALKTDKVNFPIPDGFGLTIVGFCEKHQYPLETHFVTTEDGYIIGVHRIPHGRNNGSIQDGARPPLLLVHGVLMSSTDWVYTGPDRSLAFQLADQGYDVWLMNMRGNSWSRNHTEMDPNFNKTYWQFSFTEVGMYDVPATIEYILKTTGVQKLTYVGFSEGTSAAFAMTSTRPEYNDKLNLFVALAPVAYMRDTRGLLMFLAKQYELVIEIIMELFNLNEIPRVGLIADIVLLFCNDDSLFQGFCADLIFLLTGDDHKQLNNSFIPVFFSNFPESTSVHSTLHYLQLIEQDYFRMYDWGPIDNQKKYNSTTPPDFDVTKITAPVALYHGANDFFSAVTDVKKLADKLPNVVVNKLIEWEKFNHIDFILANDVNKLVNNDVIQIINKYNKK